MDALRAKVVRWAALVEEVARAHGLDQDFVVGALCVIHKESGGIPTALNKSGAHGLTQQKPQWLGRRYDDPREHLAAYARVMKGYIKGAGGYLPSANLAWASGPGAVAIWTQTGQTWGSFKNPGGQTVTIKEDKAASWVLTHLDYVSHLHHSLWPLYAGWYAGWVAAGRPASSGTVEGPHKGALPLALDVTPQVGTPTPYDGAHRWWGHERRYEDGKGRVGYAPGALAPSQDLVPGYGRLQKAARVAVASAVSVAALVGLWKVTQDELAAQATRAARSQVQQAASGAQLAGRRSP